LSKKPARVIEGAIFDGKIGPVTAQELIEMKEHEWG
jgi:hypothetical protein